MRLFVAIDLPDEHSATLAKLCRGISSAKWVKPTQLHLTLRFIGEVSEHDARAIAAALKEIRFPEFEARLSHAGTFPPLEARRQARVLWAGIEPHEPFRALRAQVNAACKRAGAADDSNPEFTPHITLARFRSSPDKELDRWIERNGEIASAPWRVTEFHLMQSLLRRTGAEHEELHAYELVSQAAP